MAAAYDIPVIPHGGGLNGAVASESRIVDPYTSNNPFKFDAFVSSSTTPPSGAFAHVVDTGEDIDTVDCFDELLYVAVIVVAPAATPVTVTTADVCPAGTVTEAGTVAFVASELESDMAAAELGADESVTRSEPTPFDAMESVDGARELTVGSIGVTPSVVNWMFGFNSTLLL